MVLYFLVSFRPWTDREIEIGNSKDGVWNLGSFLIGKNQEVCRVKGLKVWERVQERERSHERNGGKRVKET